MREEKTGLRIYQFIVIFAMAAAIAAVPSLLVWKYHVLSLSDPAVVIGLAACYIFAACAVGINSRSLYKRIVISRKEMYGVA